jgi:hypothetical protein
LAALLSLNCTFETAFDGFQMWLLIVAISNVAFRRGSSDRLFTLAALTVPAKRSHESA